MYILLIMEIYLCWYSNWWWSFVIIKKFPSKELPLVKAQLSASSQVINIYVNKVLFYPRGHSFCSHIWLFEIIGNDGWLGGTNVGNEFSGKEGGNHESCKLFHERGIWVYFPLFFGFYWQNLLLPENFLWWRMMINNNYIDIKIRTILHMYIDCQYIFYHHIWPEGFICNQYLCQQSASLPRGHVRTAFEISMGNDGYLEGDHPGANVS